MATNRNIDGSMTLTFDQFFLEQIGILFTLDMNLTGCKTWVLKTSSALSEAEMR